MISGFNENAQILLFSFPLTYFQHVTAGLYSPSGPSFKHAVKIFHCSHLSPFMSVQALCGLIFVQHAADQSRSLSHGSDMKQIYASVD